MSVVRNSTDTRWVINGAVFLITAGMILMAVCSILMENAAPVLAAIGGMVTMGTAGIFGLSKIRGEVQKTAETVASVLEVTTEVQAAAMQENTALTRKVSSQLNGGLDARMKRIAKEAMQETLEEWTRPRAT